MLLPDVARVSYVHPHHTNEDDIVCHAVNLDKLKMGLGIVAPWLSFEMKRWVFALLCAGFTVHQVFDRHVRALHERQQRNLAYHISRDDFLTPKDVSNIAKQLAHIRHEADDDDALSTRLWCLLNKGDVFIYQEQSAADNVDFILGLQTDWQLDMMLKFGHDRLLAMNSTLGTNEFKFHLYTILVFDQHHSGIPVAWAITSSSGTATTKQWLLELFNRAILKSPEWKPNAFVVDDVAVEIDAIRSVFELPILLCLWHVRRCWLKNLLRKVKDWGVRVAIFTALGLIMNMPSRPGQLNTQRLRSGNALVSELMDKFCKQEEFMAYFKEHWQKKMDAWVRAARTLSFANIETNVSMEAFHVTLKQQFLNGKRKIHGRRLDWLFHILTTEVVAYFWYQQHLKMGGFGKNPAVSTVVESSVGRALKIPDSDVRYLRNVHFPSLGQVAHVRSQSNREVWYDVFNAQSGWACCTCDWAVRGNQCKHQVKVMLMEGVPVSSMVSHCVGLCDVSFPTNESLQAEPSILEHESYHEPHLPNPLLTEDAHPPPVDGLEEDIQRLQQQNLQLAGGDFSLLQRLREDMVRSQQLLLEARAVSLDMMPTNRPSL